MVWKAKVLRDDQWDRCASLSPAVAKGVVIPGVTVDAFSMRSCGWRARAAAGVICLSVSDHIKR
jgi:hypothetical protein